MESRKMGLFRRALCIALSFSLIYTVGWHTPSYAETADEVATLEGGRQPAGNAGLPDETHAAADGAVPRATDGATEPLLDASAAGLVQVEPIGNIDEAEAQAAAEERATDVAELGYVPGQLVVVYDDEASDAQMDRALESIDGEETSEQIDLDLGTAATVEISEDLTVETAAEIIEADPAVKYAVPNYVADSYDDVAAQLMGVVTNVTSSTTEKYATQWHLNYVKAPDAWTTLANSGKPLTKVKVAIIDTGASLSHSDLQNIINKTDSIEVVYTNQNNPSSWTHKKLRGDGYTNGGSVINDVSSHGTHVSGIVAAEANNGGILGVASGGATSVANKMVDLLVIDAFSLYVKQGSGYAASATLNDILYALDYAADHNCSVVNMSLGFPTTDDSLNTMLDELSTDLTQKNNMVLVAAAGNGGNDTPSVPAMCSNVIAVTNVTASSTRASTSSYGVWCDIAAPGENILSTLHYKDSDGTFKDGYGTMSGTSMASPVVVGVAAMVRSVNPSLSAQQVRNILCATATPLTNATGMGSGVVNAKAAVDSAISLIQTGTAQSQPALLSSSNVTLSASSFAYSGYAQRPSVTVKYNGKTLSSGTHYTVTYGTSSSINLGTYFITVEGKGSYTGKVTKRYAIAAASLSGAQITAIPSQQYTGRAITPTVTVKLGSRVLTKTTDYTVSYSNNINAGTATVIVTGCKNYAGTARATFSIVKPVVTGWIKSGTTYRYVYSDGRYATGWTYLGGSWYYFNITGIMQTGWQSIGGYWYYLGTAGQRQTGWKSISGRWYYFDASGRMKTGWQKLGNSWYFFEGGGVMQTGWQFIGGSWFYFEGGGVMQTSWQKLSGKWYYLGPGGHMQTGWQYLGGSWFYFEGGGVMQTGWRYIGLDYYYFDGSGHMYANRWVGNYYVGSSGAMATNTWIGRYHVNGSGLWDATR